MVRVRGQPGTRSEGKGQLEARWGSKCQVGVGYQAGVGIPDRDGVPVRNGAPDIGGVNYGMGYQPQVGFKTGMVGSMQIMGY